MSTIKNYPSLKVFLAAFILVIAACHNKSIQNDIIIKGIIGDKPPEKIYLFDVSKHDPLPSDSAAIINGEFIFRYKADSSFSPHEVQLCMIDSFGIHHYLRLIGFKNPYIAKNIESIFFLDKGITSIDSTEETSVQNRIFVIHGSRQNIPMYRHIEFNSLSDSDSLLRQQEMTEDIRKIDQYPYSYYLMSQLYVNREMYKKTELELLMSKFNDEIKQSQLFKKCQSYLLVMDKPKTINNLFLETAQTKREAVIDTSAKYNLLVFWASWCAPCRREIPELKKIYLDYHDKGLSLSSISVDNNRMSWNRALDVEKMIWRQFVATDSLKDRLDIQLNLSAIPLIVLLDKKGNIVMKEMGFDEKSPGALNEILKKYIN